VGAVDLFEHVECFPRTELWRTILLESLLLLAVGCMTVALQD